MATTFTWNGSTDFWSNPADWTGGEPTTTGSDSAYLPDGTYTVTVDSSVNPSINLDTLTVGVGNDTATLNLQNVTVTAVNFYFEDFVAGIGTLTVNGGVLDTTTGNGDITAGFVGTPGLLDLNGIGSIGPTAPLSMYTEAGSTLEIDVSGGFVNGSQIEFIANTGTIYLANTTVESTLNSGGGFIAGITVGASGSSSTSNDVVELADLTVGGGGVTGATIASGGTVELTTDSGATVLASFTAQDNGFAFVTSTADRVNYASDGAGGVNVWLTLLCFAAGTQIRTPTGERLVEELRPGDAVLTLSGHDLVPQPIKWVGRRQVDLRAHPRPEKAAPIRIQRDAIADGVPHRDLLVSPDHAIMLDGKLICARQLVNGTTICQETGRASVTYFHIELEAHAILLSEGLTTESYLDTGNRGFFANAEAPLVLHPDMTEDRDHVARETGSCLPFVGDDAAVRPVWQRLADRAATLGLPAPSHVTTADPAPHLVAQGQTLRPLSARNGRYVFTVPAGTTEICLVSRAGRPTDTLPWLEDQRTLGLRVARVTVSSGPELHDIALDNPRLSHGWWAPEQDAGILRRWTNGKAMIPLPALDHPTTLVIHADTATMAYVAEAEGVRRAA